MRRCVDEKREAGGERRVCVDERQGMSMRGGVCVDEGVCVRR